MRRAMRFVATGIIACVIAGCGTRQERGPGPQAAETRVDMQQQGEAAPGILAPIVLEVEASDPVAPGEEVTVRISLRVQGLLLAPIDLQWNLDAGVHLVDGAPAERIEAIPDASIARALRLRVDDPGARLEVLAEMRGDGFGATARRTIFLDGRTSEEPLVPPSRRPPGGYELQPLPKGTALPEPSRLPPGLPVGKP